MLPEWLDISTAPRDGTVIALHHPESGSMLMHWNPIGSNALVQPEPTGIWETPCGSMTWSEADDCGPSHWMTEANYTIYIEQSRLKKLH